MSTTTTQSFFFFLKQAQYRVYCSCGLSLLIIRYHHYLLQWYYVHPAGKRTVVLGLLPLHSNEATSCSSTTATTVCLVPVVDGILNVFWSTITNGFVWSDHFAWLAVTEIERAKWWSPCELATASGINKCHVLFNRCWSVWHGHNATLSFFLCLQTLFSIQCLTNFLPPFSYFPFPYVRFEMLKCSRSKFICEIYAARTVCTVVARINLYMDKICKIIL